MTEVDMSPYLHKPRVPGERASRTHCWHAPACQGWRAEYKVCRDDKGSFGRDPQGCPRVLAVAGARMLGQQVQVCRERVREASVCPPAEPNGSNGRARPVCAVPTSEDLP